MEIAAVRNGVAPIPSAERLMLTVLHLDEKVSVLRADKEFIVELRAEIDRLEACLADADPGYTPRGFYLPRES
jgi:uncharacterized small protein (DUF1192 family)